MVSHIIAIIGRPNVGKSTLFNRIIGFQKAIVHDEPGVTRDRHYGVAQWNSKQFTLIDTGGYVPDSHHIYEKAIREQTQIAMEEADQILFVVDGKYGIAPLDIEIAQILRGNKKKILLVVNKIDSSELEVNTHEFHKLGLGEPISLAALHGRNIGDFLDGITKNIIIKSDDEKNSDEIKIAIIGKPNVGKSSLSNTLTGTNRSIVTHLAGTTRDSIDSKLKFQNKNILLIDTAGLVKQKRLKTSVDFYSAMRTIRAIDRCDIAVVMIDATLKIDRQDLHIIDIACEKRKSALVVVNKWDLIEKETGTMNDFKSFIDSKLKRHDYIPQIYISAKTKKRARLVLTEAIEINNEQLKRINTSELNEILLKEIENYPPSTKTGKEVKINFITQIQVNPPHILFFANEPQLIQDSYKRFLENSIRKYWSFRGVPLHLTFRRKNKQTKKEIE